MDSSPTPTALVLAAQGGDRAAFGALVEAHRRGTYATCLRLTGDPVEAEDLAHDTFVEAYLKIGQVKRAERFGGWLHTVALNVCRMWLRRRVPQRQEVEVEELCVAEVVEEEDSSLRRRMVSGLSTLSMPHRAVLVLHYWESMSYEAIAEFMNIPVGTVMSRLHRARQSLKQIAENLEEEEGEIAMPADEEFGRLIDAEIEVLTRMFGHEPQAAERLSEILSHAPERFAGVIRDMAESATATLAALSARLSGRAIAAAVDCCFSEDARTRANGVGLLSEILAVGRERQRLGDALDKHLHEAQEAYLVLDALIAGPWPDQAKAELLVELVETRDFDRACGSYPDDSAEGLLASTVLCYRDCVFPDLLDRFWSAASVEELMESSWVRHLLANMGDRFAAEIVGELTSEDDRRQSLALKGIELLIPCMSEAEVEATSALERALASRFRGPRGQRFSVSLSRELRRQAGAGLKQTIDSPSPAIRDTAIKLLGDLEVEDKANSIRPFLLHGELSARLAALRALSNIGDRDSAEGFAESARQGHAAERRIAVEALGRLRLQSALPLLAEGCGDGDAQVRKAAAIALGEVGGEEAERTLDTVASGNDRKLAQVAARLRSEQQSAAGPSSAPSKLQQLTRERLRKVRGDAKPLYYHNTIAAIWMLPEIRPYGERELSFLIGQIEHDFAYARRHLEVRRIATRADGVFELSDLGEAIWRVEHFIRQSKLESFEPARC